MTPWPAEEPIVTSSSAAEKVKAGAGDRTMAGPPTVGQTPQDIPQRLDITPLERRDTVQHVGANRRAGVQQFFRLKVFFSGVRGDAAEVVAIGL